MADSGNNIPITRNNLFYSQEDFDYETSMVEDYFENDLNQTVIIYEVDRKRTNTDSIYKEADHDSIRVKPPKEIPCLFQINEPELKSLDSKNNNGLYQVSGNLTFYVLVKTLEKYGCDPKRGDYVGVPMTPGRMQYYAISNDGKINTGNTSFIGAYMPAWRKIDASPVVESEFNGK